MEEAVRPLAGTRSEAGRAPRDRPPLGTLSVVRERARSRLRKRCRGLSERGTIPIPNRLKRNRPGLLRPARAREGAISLRRGPVSVAPRPPPLFCPTRVPQGFSAVRRFAAQSGGPYDALRLEITGARGAGGGRYARRPSPPAAGDLRGVPRLPAHQTKYWRSQEPCQLRGAVPATAPRPAGRGHEPTHTDTN